LGSGVPVVALEAVDQVVHLDGLDNGSAAISCCGSLTMSLLSEGEQPPSSVLATSAATTNPPQRLVVILPVCPVARSADETQV